MTAATLVTLTRMLLVPVFGALWMRRAAFFRSFRMR